MAQQPIVVINSVENLKMGTSVEEGQIKVRIAFDCKMKSLGDCSGSRHYQGRGGFYLGHHPAINLRWGG